MILSRTTAAIADGAESVDDISVGGTDDAIGDLRSVDELLERGLGRDDRRDHRLSPPPANLSEGSELS